VFSVAITALNDILEWAQYGHRPFQQHGLHAHGYFSINIKTLVLMFLVTMHDLFFGSWYFVVYRRGCGH